MKKLIILALALLPTTAFAAYKLPLVYRAVYCYPTGSYWQAQRAAYPEYYQANNAYYKAQFGSSTMYCPAS